MKKWILSVFVISSLPLFAAKWDGRANSHLHDNSPWPTKVEGHVPVEPGEHPRLFFRKSDLPELRRRAETPEGKQIIKRLRFLLNGSDGESMPPEFNSAKTAYQMTGGQRGGRIVHNKPGTFTFTHAAGYGLLYQLTGDEKYAEFARLCMLKMIDDEQRDRDSVYGLYMSEHLRMGPVLAGLALGWDLNYDGWDVETRKHIADRLLNLDGRNGRTIDRISSGQVWHPGCNHWGPTISGGPMIGLAMMGDPEADQEKVDQFLEWGLINTKRQLTEGIGDYGFYGGGQGSGGLTKDAAFIPLIQAWKVAAGIDFMSNRDIVDWLTLEYVQGSITQPGGGKPEFPLRGAYPHNYFARTGVTGSGYFVQGFGTVDPKYHGAMLWLYNRSFRDSDHANGTPFGTINKYPHRCILALVNWPFDVEEQNPGEVLPRMTIDRYWNMVNIRERWKDHNDRFISVLTEQAGGHYRSPADVRVMNKGSELKSWYALRGNIVDVKQTKNAYYFKTDKGSLGIDFSRASGAEVLMVWKHGEEVLTRKAKLKMLDKKVPLPEAPQGAYAVQDIPKAVDTLVEFDDVMGDDMMSLEEEVSLPKEKPKRQKGLEGKYGDQLEETPFEVVYHVQCFGGNSKPILFEDKLRIGKQTASYEDGWVKFAVE